MSFSPSSNTSLPTSYNRHSTPRDSAKELALREKTISHLGSGFLHGRALKAGFGVNVPIIAFCHLGWDGVWQRPQQFLSRLAKRHAVLFVELYCVETEHSHANAYVPESHPNVTVLQMRLPAKDWNKESFIDSERRRLLLDYLAEDPTGRFEGAVLWFNDPMAVTAFAGHCDERAIVYDCMDELSQFKCAPPALLKREHELIMKADVIFCGGRKMRDKRLPINPNCHFYGTGVDCRHFGSALDPDSPVDPAIAALTGPVLGYFGVIDERIDYPLLAKLADIRSDWHIVMVGPTAKVNPADFPKRPNLHWLGGRPYSQLPSITKGFSIALMPFAINAATEYINPTKALEYMAAGKPIVSTALSEVMTNFESIPHVARTHAEFILHCGWELASPSPTRIQRGLTLAAENTWEVIAGKMEGHIANVLDGCCLPTVREPAATFTYA